VIEWALRRKGIPERMVEAVMALFVNSRTRVKQWLEYQRSLTLSGCTPRVSIEYITCYHING